MRKAYLFIFLAICLPGALQAARDDVYPQPVVARDGRFYVGDRRLKLWGVNLGHWHCADYKGADLTIRRIRDMGFNAVALWINRGAFQESGGKATDYREPVKGDGSKGDLFDYVVWRARQEKLYIVMTVLQRVLPQFITEADYDATPGGSPADRKAWLAAVNAIDRNFSCTKYIDPRVRRLYFDKAKWFLNRTNPYTGLRYAEDNSVAFYQMQDEEGYMVKSFWARGWRDTYWGPLYQKRFNKYLELKYGGEAKLRAAWGKLAPGESLAAGSVEIYPGGRFKNLPAGRWEDITTFFYGLAKTFHEDFIETIRAQAPKGVGINAQPVCVDSIIYTKAAGFYEALNGSFLCATAPMSGAGELEEKDGRWSWQHWGRREPKARFMRLEGMAFCPLSGGCPRPNPYRAASPVARAVYASWQDHDGAFFYWWGWPAGGKLKSDEDYGRLPLSTATPDKRKDGHEMLADEIFLASCRSAAALFLGDTIKPAQSPTTFVLGREMIFGRKAFDYYDRIWPEMTKTAFARGARLRLDTSQEVAMKAVGPVVKKLGPVRLRAGSEIVYEYRAGYMKVDSPGAKAAAGDLPSALRFRDGVELKDISKRFAVFALAAKDGRPVAQSRDMTASLVSQSRNTGYRFDLSKVEKNKRWGFGQSHLGVVNAGKAPVIVERVGAQLVLPRLAGRRCRKLDFAMRVIADVQAETGVSIKPSEPVFALDFHAR